MKKASFIWFAKTSISYMKGYNLFWVLLQIPTKWLKFNKLQS